MAETGPVMTDVDMRGFCHALEPLQKREAWKLQRLLSEHGKLCRQVQAREAAIREWGGKQREEASAIEAVLRQRMDPGHHRRALAYLEQLHRRLVAEQQLLRRDIEAQAASQRACNAQHLKVEGLAQHRDAARIAYAGEQRTRQAVEADRNWMARRPMGGLAEGSYSTLSGSPGEPAEVRR